MQRGIQIEFFTSGLSIEFHSCDEVILKTQKKVPFAPSKGPVRRVAPRSRKNIEKVSQLEVEDHPHCEMEEKSCFVFALFVVYHLLEESIDRP